MPISHLWEVGHYFLVTLPILAVLFLVILFVATLIEKRFSGRIYAFFQRGNTPAGYVGGALLGAATPLCSVTTFPVLTALLRSGAPFGPTMAFLIASPLLDAVVVGVLVFLIGPGLTALYVALTFLASIAAGALMAASGLQADVKDMGTPIPAADPSHGGVSNAVGKCGPPQSSAVTAGTPGDGTVPVSRWRRAWREVAEVWAANWRSFMPMLKYLVLAVAVAAVVQFFVPSEWILAVVGPRRWFAVPLAAVLGLPVYINLAILMPIGKALVAAGVVPGAIVAFVITGLGMSASEVPLLAVLFRPRLIAAIMSIYVIIAIGGGLLASVIMG